LWQDFFISLNALGTGNPDKGDGDFDAGEGVKEDVDAIDE